MSSHGRTTDGVRLAVPDGLQGPDRPLISISSIAADADKLLRIANLAAHFDNHEITDDARSAAERIVQGRFYVACVGQFKRGKSTLLNALIGERALPSGVVPVTSVPTVLRFGESHAARVRLRSGEWMEIETADIEEYVSEARNPENRKGVVGLEVFVPSPLLAEGMCFVDTPGLGSVFAGNTAATHAFLPHIDAAIVVIGADPPISGDELALVESLAKKIPGMLFVLNKADRVSGPECDAAVLFARQVLERRLQRPIHSIFEVSALEQLEQGSSQREWTPLVDALEQLGRQSGQQLVCDAANRSLRRLSGQLLTVTKKERDALTLPFVESERRIHQLREIVSQAEQSLNDLGYLLTGEQQRLSKTFGDRRDGFLQSARALAHRELSSALDALPRTHGPRYRRSALQAAQDVARRHVLPWLESEKRNAEEAYLKVAGRFADMANDFLAKVGSSGGQLAQLPEKMDAERDFRTRSEFRFYDFIHVAMPASPGRYLADFLLGTIRAHGAIDDDARGFLDLLLEANSERVRNDLEQRVSESRRYLETQIRIILRDLSGVSERALARARTVHALGAAAVESSLKTLAAIEAELASLNGIEAAPLEHS